MLFPIQIVYNEIKEGGFVESRVEEIRALADLLSEMIRQFIKTKEELMRTTLKAQMELLTNRAKRLKISISEIKSEMDKFCIPEEARLVEESIGDKVVPYNGASIKEDDTISELSWKSRKMLEQEKEVLLKKTTEEKLKGAIERVYTLYSNLSLSLCEQYSYNMNNYLAR